MKRKYHSGLMPWGAEPNGFGLLPQFPGKQRRQGRQQSQRDIPADHVPQQEMRDERHEGTFFRRPAAARRSSGTLMPCFCTR